MTNPLILLALPAVFCTADAAHTPGGGVPAGVAPSAFAAPTPARADSLAEVYQSGLEWDGFFEAISARRTLWEETWAAAVVPPDLAERARAAGGPWRILAITEFGCSDSANTLPYVAKLAQEVGGIELRIVNSTVGRPWMEAHRTPDGRTATPTILVLDAENRIRGCFVEQPAGLQSFWLDAVARGTTSQESARKAAWYQENEGREALREIVEILEGAHRGVEICPGTDGR